MHHIAPPPQCYCRFPYTFLPTLNLRTENQEVLTFCDLRTRFYLVKPRFRMSASTLGSRPRNSR